MARTFFSLFKQTKPFLIPFGIFLILAGIVFSIYSKEQIHISINRHYSAFGDFLMPKVTMAADGITITVLVLLLFARNRKLALFTGISCLLASFITHSLKLTIFNDQPRPKLFFSTPSPLRFVPGIENYLYDTFPSGHTTVAFAFLFSLVFAVKNKFLKVGFLLLALLVGYSRIYLSQHFLEDVYAGAIIGTVSTFLVFFIAVHKKWFNIPTGQLNEN